METRQRLIAALTAVAGIAALAITVAFGMLPAVKTAGACFSPGSVLRFELATTPAELVQIFHAASDPCRPLAIAAMDQSNHLDVYAYIPTYTAFTVLAVLFAYSGRTRPLAVAAIAAAVVALAADYVETVTLLTITGDLGTGAELLGWSSTAAWLKFGMLAAHALLLAGLCFRQTPQRRILGALLLLPAPAYLVMRVVPPLNLLLTLAFAASWTPLMLVALRDAVLGPRPVVAYRSA